MVPSFSIRTTKDFCMVWNQIGKSHLQMKTDVFPVSLCRMTAEWSWPSRRSTDCWRLCRNSSSSSLSWPTTSSLTPVSPSPSPRYSTLLYSVGLQNVIHSIEKQLVTSFRLHCFPCSRTTGSTSALRWRSGWWPWDWIVQGKPPSSSSWNRTSLCSPSLP